MTLGSFVNGAVDAVRHTAQAKNVQLVVQLEHAHLELEADGERLQQVVWNLVNNAVKFTPEGGSIRVTDSLDDTRLRLSVSDDGAGIEATLLPHVFEAFRQGDASSTRSHGGLGLGLAIVKHLVQLHAGTVIAESAGPGEGSTFTVRLPLPCARAATGVHPIAAGPERGALQTATEDTSAHLHGVHVLVVDDDPEARDILQELLLGNGATVSSAGAVPEAVERFREQPPDILISDIGMPELDGHALIARLRALPAHQGGQVPAIALSAYARDLDRQAAEKAGFQRHLAKPASPSVLLSTITELLGEAGSSSVLAARGFRD